MNLVELEKARASNRVDSLQRRQDIFVDASTRDTVNRPVLHFLLIEKLATI